MADFEFFKKEFEFKGLKLKRIFKKRMFIGKRVITFKNGKS